MVEGVDEFGGGLVGAALGGVISAAGFEIDVPFGPSHGPIDAPEKFDTGIVTEVEREFFSTGRTAVIERILAVVSGDEGIASGAVFAIDGDGEPIFFSEDSCGRR